MHEPGIATTKGFRPSRLADRDMLDDETQIAKEAKIALYEMRARAGLPIFEEPPITSGGKRNAKQLEEKVEGS